MSSFTKTVTGKQLAANQANGSKSHGPSTPEGKAISSQNAFKHGFSAAFRVLPCESQEMFDDLLEQFLDDEKPVGSVERELVRRMAEYTWLRDRATRFMDACYRVPEQTPGQYEPGKGAVYVSKDLERFMRHHAHINREFTRASAELLKRRKERELRENRFVLQKRAEAAERRREKHEQRQEERHFLHAANAKLTLERKERALAAASGGQSSPLTA